MPSTPTYYSVLQTAAHCCLVPVLRDGFLNVRGFLNFDPIVGRCLSPTTALPHSGLMITDDPSIFFSSSTPLLDLLGEKFVFSAERNIDKYAKDQVKSAIGWLVWWFVCGLSIADDGCSILNLALFFFLLANL